MAAIGGPADGGLQPPPRWGLPACSLFWRGFAPTRVDTGNYALVIEFGNPVQVVTTPGLGFKYPYQSVRTFDRRLFAFSAASTEFLTLEKTPVVAASTILWRISDPKKFFQTVFDRAGAESQARRHPVL